ncbi:protein SCAR4 [Lactuca sativa]|uniref:Protein SCAR n=1 Tax=Lactuca sativa TaxID=4236 RepID=A0A9R1WRB8_LACSA|nr:protein SCAR4 [Lactuca sativa]KAJ0184704.1 hypothetical protein LSAT_V11C900469970 [Lactuca sativa]
MPFSRYQIRNEFSLADPELYKAADKDDPEALLEGVAMAGLVGVLRQLGDLAEFAAEIFHGLHEEVMVTATRGHGLLVRVQQLESDFPAIERAFLSQTGHSAFFSSSGIGWHPNLQTEQNLITRGDLPRFVMDSYEESRGPPRLFLLDKFDIAGAGACLKRYTDPSFYKVEASSFEMRNTEAQRGKNVRKTKKKGSKWKNGETPDVFQPSHVKLHQLLLEERMQNGTSEPTRHVKLKKREIKFPFDTETGKGYMETLLTSPPEDKLVHEVPVRPMLETHDEGIMVNSPSQNGSPFESPSVDKSVSMEHMNNMSGIMIPELPENETEGDSGIEEEEEEVEEKHISVEGNHKVDDVSPDGYQSDDVVSEGENYVDALATMESEIETETELRTNSDANLEQIQSQFSDSQSGDEIENGSIKKKMETFSDSETSTTSTDNTPRSVTFASTEIPFRPRILPSQVSDEGVVLEESGSKESGLSEMSSSNQIDPEAIAASTNDDPSSSNLQSEDGNSNSTLEISQVEEQQPSGPTPSSEEVENCDADVEVKPSEEISFIPDTCSLLKEELTDDVLESKSDRDSDEIESKDDSNSDNNNYSNNNNNLPILEDEKESVNNSVTNPDEIDNNESKSLSTCEDTELDERKVESFNSEIEALTFADEKDEDADDDGENGPVIDDSDESVGKQESVITPELDSIPSESGEKKEPDVSTELDSVPSAAYDHSNIQSLDSIPTNENLDENLTVLEKTDENGDVQLQPDLDFESNQDVVESKSTNNEIQEPVYEESSMEDLPQLGNENISDEVNFNYPLAPVFTELNMLPPLSPPINLEEMPPLPPLPPMQWRMGKLPNNDDQQQNHFPPPFPQIMTPPSLPHQNEITENPNSQHDNHQDTEISTSTSTSHTEQAKVAEEQIVILPKPSIDVEEQQSQNVSTSGQESSVSSIHEGDDDERPNGIGIRPMKVQRPRTPLIDAVAAHDKSKLRKVSERARPEIQEEEERDTLLPLRKVSERARPQIPKEEERDTLLEQIRAKSFNLKPAVQTRPIIQGPSTNLRVAAILEKANAIRHAFAGSDEDEDDDDSWSE